MLFSLWTYCLATWIYEQDPPFNFLLYKAISSLINFSVCLIVPCKSEILTCKALSSELNPYWESGIVTV